MTDPSVQRLTDWGDRAGPRLLAVARAFAESEDDAEDILQETWLVLLRRQAEIGDAEHGEAWLYRTVLNIGRSRVRKRTRRRLLRRMWLRSESVPPPVGASIGGAQAVSLLWREIAELPELQRRVLLLRVVEGLSTKEAADAIDRAEGTVKASLHRAIKTLRGRLGSQGVDVTCLLDGAR